ncbi:MAG: hypothetical protein Q4E07_01505 [Eubacteriales bacterium]|nr:hypothetical protein [Eubacteriales bacterium]
MKKFAIALLLLALLMGTALTYALVHTKLDLEIIAPSFSPANTMQEQFERWAKNHAAKAVQGTVFDESPILNIDNYYFHVYSVRLKNTSFLPVQMCEMQISPKKGDVLSYSGKVSLGQSDNKSTDIPAGGSAILQQVLLTQSPGGEAREITVSYYIWGHPFFVKETIKPEN